MNFDEHIRRLPAQTLFGRRATELLPLRVNTGLASNSPVAGVAVGAPALSPDGAGAAGGCLPGTPAGCVTSVERHPAVTVLIYPRDCAPEPHGFNGRIYMWWKAVLLVRA